MYNNAHLRNTLDTILTHIELTTSNYLKVYRDMAKNYLNKIRESLLMSKAELARKALRKFNDFNNQPGLSRAWFSRG